MVKVFIKTFGCALNQSDSEAMAGVLRNEGHIIVYDDKKADVVIINSCTVKNSAENKLYQEIRKQEGKIIIVAGCAPQADKTLIETKLKDYSIIGVNQISKIGIALKKSLEGEKIVFLKEEKKVINFPRVRKNRIIGIIPLSEGCVGNCAYCKTKHARGELKSYKKEEIVEEIEKAVKDGAKEIWLTSQDTGAYGLDINETLPKLLEDALKIKGDFKVRLGMLNPNFGVLYKKELKKVLLNKKMFRFIHMPLQSGSDKILKSMNRKYYSKEYIDLVKELKKDVQNITIATDIIVGFPGESEKDFEKTVKLVKTLKPDVINISRFWKRPKTLAAKMKQLDSKIIKERSIVIRRLFHKISLEKNLKWIGWSGKAVIDERGKNNTLIARNFAYKPIIIKDEGQKLGDIIKVKIYSASTWDLRGEIIYKKL